jgi:hypothetical protein
MGHSDREMYAIVLKDWYLKVVNDVQQVLDIGRDIPFAFIAGLIFLTAESTCIYNGLQLAPQPAVNLILLCGMGCMLSAFELFTKHGTLRTIEAISCFIGNAYLMLLLPQFSL